MAEKELYLKVLERLETPLWKYFMLHLLGAAVSFQTISTRVEDRFKMLMMSVWLRNIMLTLNLDVKYQWSGKEKVGDKEYLFPPILIAHTKKDENKATVCVYGYYDISPIEKGESLRLTLQNDRLFGHGVAGRATLMTWFTVLLAYKECDYPLPINIKFIIQGMAHNDDEVFNRFLKKKRNILFSDVHCVCICDINCFSEETRCLCLGHRGICYFSIEIECAKKDLRSGVYGGTLNEAMSDLLYLLNQLVDVKGNILIPNIYDDVEPTSESEKKRFKSTDFNVLMFRRQMGAHELLFNENKQKILMHLWKLPSLSIHGIEGCCSEPGRKADIPHKVTAKFSIRTVPHQSHQKIETQVIKYLNHLWHIRRSKNFFKVNSIFNKNYWITDPASNFYRAAANAIKHVYNQDPDYVYQGKTLILPNMIETETGKKVLLLPLGPDDRTENLNSIPLENYLNGAKVIATFLNEFAEITENEYSASGTSSLSKYDLCAQKQNDQIDAKEV